MYDKNVVEQIMASTACEQDEAEGILSQIEDIAIVFMKIRRKNERKNQKDF